MVGGGMVGGGMVAATTDYVKTECRIIRVVESRVYLALGCGTAPVTIHKLSAACHADPTAASEEECYKYTDEEQGNLIVSDQIPAALLQDVTTELIELQRDISTGNWDEETVYLPPYSVYDEYSMLVPLCPRLHHVIPPQALQRQSAQSDADFEDMLNAALGGARSWQDVSSWCGLCRVECIDENAAIPLQRSPSWQPCDGSTQEDTQNRCQEGCDLNFYFDTVANKCVQCELCEANTFPVDGNADTRRINPQLEACPSGLTYNWRTDLCDGGE